MQHPGKCDQARGWLVTQAPGVPCFSGAPQHGGARRGGSRGQGCCFQKLFPSTSLTLRTVTDSTQGTGRAAIAKCGGPSHRLRGRWNHPHWWRSPSGHCLQTDWREGRKSLITLINTDSSLSVFWTAFNLLNHFWLSQFTLEFIWNMTDKLIEFIKR